MTAETLPNYASKTVTRHVVRGVLGLAAMLITPIVGALHPLLPLATIAAALIAFRGCPTCWIVGMGQLMAAKAQGKPIDGICVDGSCALPKREP